MSDGERRYAPSTSGLVEALWQAIALLRDDRLDEAEAAFIGILERWPGQPDALHFQGVLRHCRAASTKPSS